MPEFRDVPPDAPPEDEYPNGYEDPPEDAPGWEAIVNAPDYSQLIATRQSRRAKLYTDKVNSVLKAGTFACINAGDFPDAAAILHHGPPFSYAAGQLADKNEKTARIIDLITSPESPAVLFAITASVIVTQLLRNHEDQIKRIPETRREARRRRKAMATAKVEEPPRFTIRILGREFPIRYRSKFRWSKAVGVFRIQTQDPEDLTLRVFSDPDVMKSLEKQGFTIRRNEPTTPA